jgi:hypothetical protein
MEEIGFVLSLATLTAALLYLILENWVYRAPFPSLVQQCFVAIALPASIIGLTLLVVG